MAANNGIGILLLLVSSMLFLCLFGNNEDNFVGKNSNDTTVFSFIYASIVAVPVTIFYAYWNWISVQFLRHS